MCFDRPISALTAAIPPLTHKQPQIIAIGRSNISHELETKIKCSKVPNIEFFVSGMYLVICAVIVVWLVREFYWKRRNLPPGPLPLPFIGNFINFIWHQPGYTFFENCKRDYGKIFTFWMGKNPVICLSDLELMKETFVKDGDAYTGKFDMGLTEVFRGGKYGIVESEGDRWREHRRFVLHQLRDLGLGKMRMEQRIIAEVVDLSKKLAEMPNIDIFAEFHRHVANVINQLLFGYRFENERAPEFTNLMALLKKQQESNLMIVVVLFPWTRKLPIFSTLWKKFLEFRDEFYAFFEKQIEEHVKEINYDQVDSTDYVEAYLKEKKTREDEGDFESFCEKQLLNVCFDMWSAGLSTTTATLCWGLFYILHHPEVQKKLHEELDKVIGGNRPITMADRNNLTYTMAVINEIQRALNMVVFNLPHSTTRDVEIEGYKIPKDTIIAAQITNLLYDKEIFPDPEKFDPERFIDDNGKLKKFDEMLPFSIGKRQCPGEGLARMELFLFIANLFNRFTFSCRGELPSLKKTFKNVQQPADFIDLEATPRF